MILLFYPLLTVRNTYRTVNTGIQKNQTLKLTQNQIVYFT